VTAGSARQTDGGNTKVFPPFLFVAWGRARSSGRRFVSFLANKTRRSRPRKRVYFTVRSAVK